LTSQSGLGASSVGLPDEMLEVLSRNPLPALIVEVPSARILAVSPAARVLFGQDDSSLVGHTVESLTADVPTDAFGLLIRGRLSGYETVRQYRLGDGSLVPLQTWVRTFGEEVPIRHVLFIFAAQDTATGGANVAMPNDFGALIGTTDIGLVIDRVSCEVDTISGRVPEELLGQTIFEIVQRDDIAGLLWAIAHATSTGKSATLHVHVNSATEHPQPCQMLLLPKDPVPSFVFGLVPTVPSERSPYSDLEAFWSETRGVDVFGVSHDLAGLAAAVPGLAGLSSRELDVLTRLVAGYRVPAIARALFISRSTVRSHLSSIFRKLGVESQQELIDLLVGRTDTTSSDK